MAGLEGVAGAAGQVAASTPYGMAASAIGSALEGIAGGGGPATSAATSGNASTTGTTQTNTNQGIFGTKTYNFGGTAGGFGGGSGGSGIPPWVLPLIGAVSLGLTLAFAFREGKK